MATDSRDPSLRQWPRVQLSLLLLWPIGWRRLLALLLQQQ